MKRNKAWIQRQKSDPYVKSAKQENYRSRAIYKLQEIDNRDRLFKPGKIVLDLGAAPGSWSQYASERIKPGGKVIALDRQKISEIPGVNFIQGDIFNPEIVQRCISMAGEHSIDLVISDLAPNLTGIRDTDQARSMELADSVLEIAKRLLKPGGDLLVKLFEGSSVNAFREELSSVFQRVNTRKPGASRDSSREIYMLARGYGI